ncbi:MAG TPA: hypothetical protein ENH43_02210 [Phycisphaerales bacterium]|nr:hypothetical protein [Phycisphaerales bacterium]
MAVRKNIFSLLVATSIFHSTQKASQALGAEDKPTKEIVFRLYFNNYNAGIDWNALSDLKNNPILNACMTEVTAEKLESLQIPDLKARLQKLQRGKLVRKVGTNYKLAFPAIWGEKKDKLQKIVENTASKVLPKAEQIIKKITPYLKNRKEMLYHVVWSIVMDGPIAWNTLNVELKKQLKKTDSSITATTWLKYPNHPYRVGTNTYSDIQNGAVKITWSRTTPTPSIVHQIIKKYESELIQSVTNSQPLKGQKARQALAQYGLVDEKGIGRVYIIDPASETAQTFGKVSRKFANEVMTDIDVQEAAKMLGVTPAQALVIVYHELCYELLERLAAKRILEVPKIVLKPAVGTDQTYRLVSVINLRKLNLPDQ